MGIERVSEVKPPEHWIGALQLVAQASGGDHSHSSAFDRLDLCLISIEQSSAMIVFGPPAPVTGMYRQPLHLEERQAIVLRPATDPARPQGSCITLAIDEAHIRRPPVDSVDLEFHAWDPLTSTWATNIEAMS